MIWYYETKLEKCGPIEMKPTIEQNVLDRLFSLCLILFKTSCKQAKDIGQLERSKNAVVVKLNKVSFHAICRDFFTFLLKNSLKVETHVREPMRFTRF